MILQKIFSNYPNVGESGTSKYHYCVCCGEKYVTKAEGDRQRLACPKCGFIHYRNATPAVSILIVDDAGKVLLGKRADWNFRGDKWCLPCGFIEFDEDFLTAARRESKEETGYDVEIDGIINVTHNFFNPEMHHLVVVLKAHVVGGVMQANDDIVELAWFDVASELPEMAFAADAALLNSYCQGKGALTVIECE